MPLPPEQRVTFFVYVIESPSAVDLYHRRSEGDVIRQAVNLNQIPCVVKTAISFQAFEASLKIGLVEAVGQVPGCIPILHISAHGSSNGIQLSSGEVIQWHLLKDFLRPINNSLNSFLIVCMSSCEGYAGIRMAMHLEDQDYPFLALVGNSQKPTWGETAVGYAAFYHQLYRGEHISIAVTAMRAASGNQMFFLEHAQESRRAYLEYISDLNTSQVQASLQKQYENEPPGHLDNLRKLILG